MDQKTQFNLNYGTKPTTTVIEEITVQLNPQIFVEGYAKAYLGEMVRRNPMRAKASAITADDLQDYFMSLIAIRMEQIQGHCPVWRQAKELYVPAWIQFVLSRIGRVVDVERGLMITPSMKSEYDIDKMLSVSNRLSVFKSDGIAILKDAFPRSIEGDKDLMMMAIINGYVQSMTSVPHPIQSYISAFLGMRLEEEATYKLLYRVRYDEVNFIKQMLLHEEAII